MSIKVGNIKEYGLTGKLAGRKHIYIGRSGKGQYSPLGNPFQMGRDGTRDEVVAKYKVWLWNQIQSNNSEVINELKKIAYYSATNEVILVCFCAPLACHGDVLIKCIEWMLTQERFGLKA
jgi:hypothetical protein